MNRRRRTKFLLFSSLIVLLHAVGTWLTWVAASRMYPEGGRDLWIAFASLLQGVTFFAGLVLLILSTYNERLLKQTYEFAAKASRSVSHQFPKFEDHVVWIQQNITPRAFPGKRVHLFVSVSTPAYGIANDKTSASIFLDFVEEWVAHFERFPDGSAERSIWEMAVWNGDANRNTFCNGAVDFKDPENVALLKRYAAICRRMYALHRRKTIQLELYFTDPSDTRLFMVGNDLEKSYCGLLVAFSPLTQSAIKHKKWRLVGFSFLDRDGYENLARFNFGLQTRDHAKDRDEDDRVSRLKAPEQWLEEHYGLPMNALLEPDANSRLVRLGGGVGNPPNLIVQTDSTDPGAHQLEPAQEAKQRTE